MTQDVITIEGLWKVYQIESQQVEALRDVSLRVKQGQVLSIVGKSGAGKSTLLHVMGTLDRPSRGKVMLNGTDVSVMPDKVASHFRNCTIGFIFQMNNLLPEFSAIENVMMPGIIAGDEKELVRSRAHELLERVGLAQRAAHRPGELSGGEQQRVAIARALLKAPQILLADEPTGNLDKKTSHAVQDLLVELTSYYDVTMALVTHDDELAERLPHKVVMEDGRIVDYGGLS